MSCAVAIHVLTGSGDLTPHATRIRQQILAAAAAPLRELPLGDDDVDVVVQHAPQRVIPEVGLGGFAPDGHTIFLALDTGHEKFEWALERELFRTLAHELHHVARRRASVQAQTLLDALVHEGLADHFSLEVTDMEPPPWTAALTPAQLADMGERARADYDDQGYDHLAWFFGSDGAGIPRWTGYSLGFELVAGYLERHPEASASALTTVPSAALRPRL